MAAIDPRAAPIPTQETSKLSASTLTPTTSASAALPEHCYYCFEVIAAVLQRKSVADVEVPFDAIGQQHPLFVSWNIYSASALSKALGSLKKGSARLRGCIGIFEPMPLVDGLADYAQTSAFKDRRFNPIAEHELQRLECGVSLLTDFEDCIDYLDWEVGIHGIYIYLPNPTLGRNGTSSRSRASDRAYLTATYLPDVMPAQGWTKEEAIDSAIHKAGWEGKITDEMRASLRVRRYQSAKCTRTFDEWQDWRKTQANGNGTIHGTSSSD